MLEQTRPSYPPETDGLHAKRGVDAVPVLGELPDLLLVERTRGRDTRAFETLMRRYNRRLFRIARSILNTTEAAEEAVRAAYLRAFANLDRYEPAGKFGAWLARLAFNEALALRRHTSAANAAAERPDRVAPAAGSPPPIQASAPAAHAATLPPRPTSAEAPATPDPSVLSDPMDAEANRRAIERGIDALPEVFRTVLVLRVVEELSGVEVAACLGLNETTVRTRLYRAQQRLQDLAARLRSEPSKVFELTPQRNDHIVSQVFARLHAAVPTTEAR